MASRRSRADDGSGYHLWSRRHYLVATAGIGALSGCLGGDGDDADGTTVVETTTMAADDTDDDADDGEDDDDEELPEGVSREEFESGPVPDVYLSATSIGGEQRGSEELFPKADVQFSEYEEAQENNAHQPGRCCANCHEYIYDRNGDAFGACVTVEGYIDGADWCTVWEELPEPSVPEGLTEDELPTAQVPEQYRTASSQGGGERDPTDLQTQEDVRLMESVDAIADGLGQPGQSCGNCAEFIPDENGDGWGACAKVEGYVAAEDWCAIWVHITDAL
ncbi:high-potential iron-sulfur protein [Haloarchaeobius salinus]|uniref:high-potential iron-sulfur protein n=1 Tax=Haloarchaeobius salinus TaxID=1198298 RepID=UPI00210A507F|nr:high-potential iron-sulfur protein [Haloarchaeobius salinus]